MGGSTSYFRGYRSCRQGPYHYCARCGTRFHISDLEWQRGLLICRTYCYDYGNDGYPLTGQRELAIIAVFEEPTMELLPDPKLTDSQEIQSSMEEDLIY
jgi:hypothetical protein